MLNKRVVAHIQNASCVVWRSGIDGSYAYGNHLRLACAEWNVSRPPNYNVQVFSNRAAINQQRVPDCGHRSSESEIYVSLGDYSTPKIVRHIGRKPDSFKQIVKLN